MNYLKEAHKISQFYECKLSIHHNVASMILPSNQFFASWLLGLMNVPENGAGFYYMQPVSNYLIQSYIEQESVELSPEFKFLYYKFWESIRSLEYSKLGFHNRSTRGFRLSNPVYAFLFIACAHGGASYVHDSGDMLVSFDSFSAFFFKKINKYRNQGYSDSFIERISLVARKLIVANDNVKVKRRFHPSRYEKEQISRVALCDHDIFVHSIFEPSNKTYVYDLMFREGREERSKCDHERDVSSVTGRWSQYENGLRLYTPIELPEHLILDKHFKISNKGKRWKIPELVNFEKFGVTRAEVSGAGETILDYIDQDGIELPAEFFIDPWQSKRYEDQKMEALVFATQSLIWDKDVVSKLMLRRVFLALETQSKTVSSIVCLALLMGMKEKQIKNIHYNALPESRNDEDDIEKIESSFKGFNFDAHEKVFWDYSGSTSRDERNYLKIDSNNKIQLPAILLRYFPDVSQGQPLFAAKDVKQAKSFLKTLGRDGVRDVTLGRLVVTFEAFFVHSFGLPILYADVISGAKRHFLKSQHYYVSQNQRHLNEQWLNFVDKFLNEYAQQTLLNLRNPPPEHFKIEKHKLSESQQYIGATNTPTRAKLKRHFSLLYSHFPHSRSELLEGNKHQWNAYVAYLYGLFSVCTGQRPLRDPIPETREISFDGGIIHITDKNSHSYREERCVPFVDVLVKALRNHQSILFDWCQRMMIEGKSMTTGTPLFFPILDKQGAIVPASPKTIDLVMFDYVGKAYISDLRNGYRHFLLTTLFQAGVEQADIDWISGHRSKNMEPESIYSPVSWRLKAMSIKQVIEDDIVAPLGLELPFV